MSEDGLVASVRHISREEVVLDLTRLLHISGVSGEVPLHRWHDDGGRVAEKNTNGVVGPTEPHPFEIHRWEDDGGRTEAPVPRVSVSRGKISMLRTIAVLLILLALIGGGFGAAFHVAANLLWLFFIVLLLGLLLGGWSYYSGPRQPLV